MGLIQNQSLDPVHLCLEAAKVLVDDDMQFTCCALLRVYQQGYGNFNTWETAYEAHKSLHRDRGAEWWGEGCYKRPDILEQKRLALLETARHLKETYNANRPTKTI